MKNYEQRANTILEGILGAFVFQVNCICRSEWISTPFSLQIPRLQLFCNEFGYTCLCVVDLQSTTLAKWFPYLLTSTINPITTGNQLSEREYKDS